MCIEDRVVMMKLAITQAALNLGLNLTVYDGKIGFVDQEQKKIVALWSPNFSLPKESEDAK